MAETPRHPPTQPGTVAKRDEAAGTCRNCGYSVYALSSFTCPECGCDLRLTGIDPPMEASGMSGMGGMAVAIALFGILLAFLVFCAY